VKIQREMTKLEVSTMIISIIAIAISIITLCYTIMKDKKDDKEVVTITFDSLSYDDYIRYDIAGIYRGQGLAGVKYKVFISNTSKQRVSFLKCDLCQSLGNSKMVYGDLLENVYNSNNRKVSFPISLEAGDSIGLILDLNVIVPQSVNMLVLAKFGTKDLINLNELRDYLGENDTDIYGNKVKYTKFGNGKKLMEIEKPHFPIYIFSLTSEKNNVYKTTITQSTN
jgi:hypothetical protein